jgi:hypothetical protein
LTDRIREFAAQGINFIIVAGACGDYLGLADTVVAFTEYKAECLTEKAKNIAGTTGIIPTPLQTCNMSQHFANTEMLQNSLQPNSAIEKTVKVRAVAGQITIGQLKSDLRKFPTFCHQELQRGIAEILYNFIKENKNCNDNLREVFEAICEKLPENETSDLALPRAIELGAAFLRASW